MCYPGGMWITTNATANADSVADTSPSSEEELTDQAQSTPDLEEPIEDSAVDSIPEPAANDTSDTRDPRLSGLGKAVIAPPPESLPTRNKPPSSKVKEFVFKSTDDNNDPRRGKGAAKKPRQKRRRRNDSDMGVQHFDMRLECCSCCSSDLLM